MLPMPQTAVGQRPSSPCLLDSPVSDDAFDAYPILTLPRVTRPFTLELPQHATVRPRASTPDDHPFGVRSPYSPSSTGSNRNRVHMTPHFFVGSPLRGNLPSVTPSPVEAASWQGIIAGTASSYFHQPPSTPPTTYHSNVANSSPLDMATVACISTFRSHNYSTGLVGDHCTIASASYSVPSNIYPPEKNAGSWVDFSARAHNRHEAPTSLSALGPDGSWALSVALRQDLDADDQVLPTPFLGGYGGRGPRSLQVVQPFVLTQSSDVRPSDVPTPAPVRSRTFHPSQDHYRQRGVSDPWPTSSAQSLSTSYYQAPLASGSGDPSASVDEGVSDASRTYSFVPLPGNNFKKRPRRRYDEIERLYRCGFLLPSGEECAKAYGTLNHLNAHIQMQRHGEKRSPNEFKDMRKRWRKARKEADISTLGVPLDDGLYDQPPDHHRTTRPMLGVQIPSAYDPSLAQAPVVSSYTPVSPTHPYDASDNGGHSGYVPRPGTSSMSYSLASGSLPTAPALYTTVPQYEPHQVTSAGGEGSVWSSPYSHARHTSSSSGYVHETLEEPTQAAQAEYAQHLVAAYGSGSQYAATYDMYASAAQTVPTQRYPPVGGVVSPETYVAQHYFLGSQPPPPDVQASPSSPAQEGMNAFAGSSTLLTPLPGYQHPSLLDHNVVSSTPYTPATPRNGAPMSTASTLMQGAWRQPQSHDPATHQPTRHH